MSSKSVIKLIMVLLFLLNNCKIVQMRSENEKVKLELTILEQKVDETTKENKKVSILARLSKY